MTDTKPGTSKVQSPPDFPTKEEMPHLTLKIQSHKNDVGKDTVRVFLTDATGGRNIKMPLDGVDLDASELTWAITKILRQWVGLPV